MAMTPAPLTDQQQTHLSDKRSAYLKSSKQDNNTYLPSQPIWFIDDSSDEWKPGYIESKDITPDSYWITNDKNSRRFRRNKHDIKPRYITITQQGPKPQVPVRYPAHLSDDDTASAIPEVQEPVSPSAETPTTLAKSAPASNNQNAATPKNNPNVGKIRTPADLTPMLTRSRSGRLIKRTRNTTLYIILFNFTRHLWTVWNHKDFFGSVSYEHFWHFGSKTILKGDMLYYANERFVIFHDFYMMSTLEFWTSCFSQQPCLFLKL